MPIFCTRQWRKISLVTFLLATNNLLAAPTIEIQLVGVKGELRDNIIAFLSLERQKDHPRLTSQRIQRLHKQAPAEIQQALAPFGYYQVEVKSHLTQVSGQQDTWLAKYEIELGKPSRIQAIDIHILGDAQQDEAFQQLLTTLPIKVGDVLNHERYETSKRLLVNLAEERGYFDAQLTQNQIQVNKQTNTVNMVLTLDSKRRYRFGEVTFQQEFFKESLLQRFIPFKPNDYYTNSALLAFQNALTNSDYFANVNVTTEHSTNQGNLIVPITVTLEQRKRNKYGFGIGYGTDTGARGVVEWKRRYLNRFGHRFSLKGELSELRYGIMARYYIPLGNELDNFLTINAGYKNENTATSKSELLTIGVNKNHSRTFFNRKLTEIIGIEYRDEKFNIGSEPGHAKMLMPSISWSYVKADNRVYTLNGYKLQLDIQGALNNVGSNVSFLQTHLSGVVIRQFWQPGRIIARGDFGYTAVDLLHGEFNDLPPSIRFFAGGDRSVRGYDYHVLGPTNAQNLVIGGKNLLVGSLEYEHRLLEKWSVATFYDVGNAFNDFSEPIKHSVGIGLRWQSPVGLIRVDVATALKEEGNPIRLHVMVGPDL